jgi:hypothetical protein
MKFSLVILLFLSGFSASAQYDIDSANADSDLKEPKLDIYEIKKKIYVGGDLSMRFGNLTYIYAAPLAGYEFYKGISAGITGIYQLVRVNNGFGVVSESTYGGGLFVRYRPLDFLLVQTEFDMLNTVNYTSAPGNRINFPVFMLGAGYAGSLGQRAYYNVMLMYDFIDDPNMTVPRIVPFAPLYLRYGFVWYLG